MKCPKCHNQILEESNFCNKCGFQLTESLSSVANRTIVEGERKHATVLFSDLTGYTTMSERMDPEEIKEITSRIFKDISKIVDKYDGFIEKYVGDAVMALFGVPDAHEDDPIRAIKVAQEIHEKVNAINPEVKSKTGQSIAMHIGINTGLVVTGEVNVARGTHRVAGDTINLASRLSNLAQSGEIIVGSETYNQAQNYFDFEILKPARVKGKQKPVKIYKVNSAKKESIKIHRLQGMCAALTGRDHEMRVLAKTAQQLVNGQGGIISICGDAGTGKSRLKREFKDTLNRKAIVWFEGHSYGYTKNRPYYPLINILTRAFQIDEADPPEKIREKVDASVAYLLGEGNKFSPYIGSLFALTYDEIEDVSPEYWKKKLHEAIQEILKALTKRKPTVICFEDLHWADLSFIELFEFILKNSELRALYLCTYRPPFKLFKDEISQQINKYYHEIFLKEFSVEYIQVMLKSLLKTDKVPEELYDFIRLKTEGNPFYLEEMVNSLIERVILVRDNGEWMLSRNISGADLPATIHGILTARVDRLRGQLKLVLQEASVIGRAFLYRILEQITTIETEIDRSLLELQNLDLIRVQVIEPELEYIFKHALTQEVVYYGLLKNERKVIHERIALVIEKLFHDRLPEFYETLAFHFKEGQSTLKAAKYLTKSGQKSYYRCALEEAQQYYKEAYNLLVSRMDTNKEENNLLIDLLNEWGFTLIWRGASTELINLFKIHEDLAESLEDKERSGMFYSSLGIALLMKEELSESYRYLRKSLELGEKAISQTVIGHTCFRLAHTCANLDQLDEAVSFGERARSLSKNPDAELPLHRVAVGLGIAYWYRGDIRKLRELGEELIDEGNNNLDLRHQAMANMVIGLSHLCAGNYKLAIQNFKAMIKESFDPLPIQISNSMLGLAYLGDGQYQKALTVSEKVIRFSEKYGFEIIGTTITALSGYALAATGNLNSGLRILANLEKVWNKTNMRYKLALYNLFYGQLYLQIVEGKGPKSFSFIIKNFWSLIRLVPGAATKSEIHFKKAIEIASDIGAKGILAQAYLGLGLLHRVKEKLEKARKNLMIATQIFEKIEAEGFLKTSNSALESLG